MTTADKVRQYAEREVDSDELMPHYLRHVSAMTVEGLHAKSAIAAELAWRDARIEAAEAECARLLTAQNAARVSEGVWRETALNLEARVRELEADALIWRTDGDDIYRRLGDPSYNTGDGRVLLERYTTHSDDYDGATRKLTPLAEWDGMRPLAAIDGAMGGRDG